ncbi:MAG: proton-conducting transporter membrane subunit [Thermus sp.]|uniref:proton-conducting transporter transmembrane domain-containing protein n=1 Tax=Thermus sp. TaxID=275 RepID=UPI00351BCC89
MSAWLVGSWLALALASLLGLRNPGSLLYGLALGVAGALSMVGGGLAWGHGGQASGFFLLLLGLLTLALALYLPAYLAHHPRAARAYALLVPLFIGVLAGVVVVLPGLPFLFLWEGMALLGYLLIGLEGPQAEAGARAFFLASRLGSAGLYLAFLGQVTLPRDWLWAGILLGFGVKAALFPFHPWLTLAHPVALSPVSALLSSAMTKLGLYGLYQAQLWFGPPPAWAAWTLVVLGLLGGVYALVRGLGEEDLKGALAYSSVENLGLMQATLGAYFLTQAPLFLYAFFLHQLSHALFKGLLFLAAGALPERRLSRLGGLWRLDPGLGALVLLGMAVGAGLPPGPLFLAEWSAYRGFLQAPGFLPLAVGVLALVGGLALYFYVRLFGLAFLGLARAQTTVHLGGGMRRGLGLLAVALLLLGLFPGFVLRPLGATFYPNGVLGLALLALAYPLYRWLKARPHRDYGTWDCGHAPLEPRMQPNGLGFAAPALYLFPFVRLRVGERPALEELLIEAYQGIGGGYARLARALQALQSGSIHLYLLLQLLALVAVLGVVLR